MTIEYIHMLFVFIIVSIFAGWPRWCRGFPGEIILPLTNGDETMTANFTTMFEEVESKKDFVVPASKRSGSMVIEDGEVRFTYPVEDFRFTRNPKNGVVTMFYNRKVKASEVADHGYAVQCGDETLTIQNESISYTLQDTQTRIIREPKEVKSELSRCRTEFNKLVRERTWTLKMAQDFYFGNDPALTIRRKRIDDPIFDYPVNIAAAGKPEKVITFMDWVQERIVELDGKKDPTNPTITQLINQISNLPNAPKMADMDIDDQVICIRETLATRKNELIELHAKAMQAKRDKLAAARAAARKV